MDYNPFQWLWLWLGVGELLTMMMSKQCKLVEICMVQIFGFVEDEWCFNILPSMKSKVHNRLNTHIDLCVKMFWYTLFTLDNSLYDEAIVLSKKKKTHKLVEAQVIKVSFSFMCCSPILFFCNKFYSLTLNLGSHNFAFAWVETWVLDVDLDIETHAPCIFEHLTFFLVLVG